MTNLLHYHNFFTANILDSPSSLLVHNQSHFTVARNLSSRPILPSYPLISDFTRRYELPDSNVERLGRYTRHFLIYHCRIPNRQWGKKTRRTVCKTNPGIRPDQETPRKICDWKTSRMENRVESEREGGWGA